MSRETSGGANLYAAFRSSFPKDRHATLLIDELGRYFSYADAEAVSARLAKWLVDSGLQAGDRVTVQVEKSVEMLWLYLACLRAGLVFHPLNTAYSPAELAYFVANARPGLIVCDKTQVSVMARLADEVGARVVTLNADGSGSLMALSLETPADFDCVSRSPRDMAALLYSSGTTGRPKGIMLSHGNLVSNARALVQAWEFTGDDVLLHALPVFHVHGLFVAIGCVLMSGASMRWLSRYDVSNVLNKLPGSTVMMGVPTYYTRLLVNAEFSRDHCRTVRLFISGSAPLLSETFTEFEQRTGHRILERYGMTETGMNTSNPLHGERRPGTVGPALPGVNVRVVDDNGAILSAGEVGNLQVKGDNVFEGYWQMPEKTVEDFTSDGFFDTGDQGVISVDGYVSIVGRAKDMVICGGLNVYPKEVELLIDTLPGVKESAVIGVPHPDFGEAVVAVVVAQTAESPPLERDVIEQCKRELANFKVPKRMMLVADLPRNTMGKVQKKQLREQFATLFTQ